MLEISLTEVDMKKSSKIKKLLPKRNNVLFDNWSIVHLTSGILIGWTVRPLYALALMIAWEPLENFILSPILAKVNLVFGYESLKNSVSDIIFDTVGITLGALLITWMIDPPFHFF